MTFLDEKFPKLSRQYRDWFKGYGYAPEAYRKEISARFENLRRKYNLGPRPEWRQPQAWHSPQLPLNLGIGNGDKPCHV
jgi:hypothetical protein